VSAGPDGTAALVAERAILFEKLQLIYGVLGQSSLTTLVLSFLVAWLLRGAGTVILVWLAVQLLLKLGEQAEVRWLITAPKLRANPLHYVRRLMVTQSLHAAGWASLLWICGRYANPAQFVVVIMALGGVLSGGITTYSALPRIHLAYILTFIVFDLVVFILLQITPGHDPIFDYPPLLLTIYCIGTYLNTRTSGENYSRTIQLGFSNARLARDLEHEVGVARDAEARAAEANAAKSTFLASASHDLRQPIHTLGLTLALLERSQLDAEQREIVHNARQALDASSDMLDALLDFSRAEAGVIVPRPHAFAIAPLLEQIDGELGILADQRQLAYRTFASAAWVHSDPALVKLILQNLIGNAIRYTERGGVLVGSRRRGDMLLVEVWDTGSGIAADQQEAIFADFKQLANPERDRRKGLGLGLAIARRLAHLLGAEITLQSRPGRGSVFRIALALAAPAHAPDALPAAPGADQSARLAPDTVAHVLIVEDDIAIRRSLALLLSAFGYSTDAVETIDEALDLARARRPGLILCDMRLRNGEKGTEAVRAIRAAVGENVPALLITGDTHPDRVAEAAGEELAVLHKPVWPEILLAAIEAALAQNMLMRVVNA